MNFFLHGGDFRVHGRNIAVLADGKSGQVVFCAGYVMTCSFLEQAPG
ncbi:hypothetical protein ACFY2J_38835 [Streptomyces collinus]